MPFEPVRPRLEHRGRATVENVIAMGSAGRRADAVVLDFSVVA